jgi:hypothetical protein
MQQKKSQQVDPSPQALSVEVRREGEGRATVLLAGRLDDRTLPEAWAAMDPIRSAPPKRLAPRQRPTRRTWQVFFISASTFLMS